MILNSSVPAPVRQAAPDRAGSLLERLGVKPALALASAVLAMVGQALLDRNGHPWLAAACYVLAAVLFLAVFRTRPLERQRCEVRDGERLRWPYLAVAAVLAALAFPRFSGNRFSAGGTLMWVISLLILGLASIPKSAVSWLAVRDRMRSLIPRQAGVSISWYEVGLLAAMALAAYLRLYRIGELPSEMGCDLPHVYSNVQAILAGELQVFFPSHPGREGLFFFVTALFARLWGLSHTTIKFSSALVGLATLPALYALGRELYGRSVGLCAAYLGAVSHWHIIASRSGLRAVMLPLLMILAWLWLVRGMRSGRRGWFYLSGLACGLGLYTYNAFVAVPVFLGGALLLCWLLRGADRQGAHWTNALLLAAVVLVVYVPLGRYAYENPTMYAFRAATRLTGMERPLGEDLLGVLVDNIGRGLFMFNGTGDSVYSTNVPFMRELGLFTAALLVLGGALVVWRWRQGYNWSVLLALGIMLLPMTLSLAFPDEVPNAFRGIGTWPSAMLLAATGLERLFSAAYAPVAARFAGGSDCEPGGGGQHGRVFAMASAGVLGATLAGAMVYEAVAAGQTCFVEFAWHQPRHNYSISLEMARVIDDYRQGQAYIVSQPYWYDGKAVRAQFRVEDQDWDNERLALVPGVPPLDEATAHVLVLVHPDDAASQEMLRERFQKGVFVEHRDRQGLVAFLAFYGER